MLRLSGRSALTPFRTEQLLAKLAKVAPNVRGVSATYAYFVDVPRVTPALEQKLAELLPLAPEAPQTAGKLVLVVPRVGTLSPWASKATDIARSCGFDDVRCIERGVAYRLEGTLGPDDLARVRPLLHDRMTETVLERFEDAGRLFRREKPRKLERVPVLKAKTVRMMRSNRITDAQRKFPFVAGAPFNQGFGLGMSVVVDPKQPGVVGGGAGTFGWPGAFGGWWQADPQADMILLWLQQCTPALPQRGAGMPRLPGQESLMQFRKTVYDTINGETHANLAG